MVSTRSNIFNSPRRCINPLVTVARSPISTDITFTFRFHSFFKSRYLFFFSFSYNFATWPTRTAKATVRQLISLLYSFNIIGLVIRPILGELFKSQNPRGFVRLIFLNKFWILLILFVHMVKFQFLAQFSVGHLVCTLIFFLS